MKNIAILGSTGSIGESALNVIRAFPGRFRVVALSANADIGRLSRQIREFKPASVCVNDKVRAAVLAKKLKPGIRLFTGVDGLEELVRDKKIDQVIFGISGSGALAPLLSAVKSGKAIALANKEALVMAGPLIMAASRKHKAGIIPVDSEQSAIWQCLHGEERAALKHIYLTASGGPLRRVSRRSLKTISLRQVLRHPRWKMGRKITVDSATLMNKGLELLEAMFLFGVPSSRIRVLVHPEALIHSMVEFIDGVVIAQLSVTDMRVPIQYALTYPERLKSSLQGIDFCRTGALTFEKPDLGKFPCLALAYEAADKLGTLPCVLNAANEVAVGAFLKEKLRFIDIAKVVEKVMRSHKNEPRPGLAEIREADNWARGMAYSLTGRSH
ncbi:MAG: 1-deoxy-D-xylulose-5-phosphate reductoisomerase [Candidatus Omnitrophota bacterium]